jgi:hypothetical protein
MLRAMVTWRFLNLRVELPEQQYASTDVTNKRALSTPTINGCFILTCELRQQGLKGQYTYVSMAQH